MKILTVLACAFLANSAHSSEIKNFAADQYFKNQCMACHGAESAQGPAPVLFGQEPQFIVRSLNEFKSDQRQDNINGVMNVLAKDLTSQQIKALAQYLAAKDPCEIKLKIDPRKEGFKEKFLAGRELVKGKNCMHCHGSFHHAAPRIIGQKFTYLKTSLENFSNQKRQTQFPMMARIAASLSHEEVEQVSTYLNGMKLMRYCGGHDENGH